MLFTMNVDYIDGHTRYGHIESDVDFSEKEVKEFKTLLRKSLNGEEITEDELEKLIEYKEEIRDNSSLIVDDYDIDSWGGIRWEELLEN